MVGPRYDLTANIALFLDPQLLHAVEDFNNGTKTEVKPAQEPSEPSLEAAKALYSAGNYAQASTMLGSLRSKYDPASSEYESITWGKLAADLLVAPQPPTKVEPQPAAKSTEEPTGEEDKADDETDPTESSVAVSDPVLVELAKAQALVDDQRTSNSLTQLNRRAWLIHWSLFAYFPLRLEKLSETFFTSQYMSVIQASCPWILRYVAVAVICTHPRTARYNRRVKDLVRVVEQELYEYSDAVIDFIHALYVDYDFAHVAEKLDAAAKLLENDFFAHTLVPKFKDLARVLIADVYVKVHEAVAADDLAKILGLGSDSADWIESFIASKQDAKLDASYNKETGLLRVNYTKPSAHSQVLEKVKTMDQRAVQLLHQAQSRTQSA